MTYATGKIEEAIVSNYYAFDSTNDRMAIQRFYDQRNALIKLRNNAERSEVLALLASDKKGATSNG
jgi:hypothetical protein